MTAPHGGVTKDQVLDVLYDESRDAEHAADAILAMLPDVAKLEAENAELKTLLADSRSRCRAWLYDRNLWKSTSDAHASVIEQDLVPLRAVIGETVAPVDAYNALRAALAALREDLEVARQIGDSFWLALKRLELPAIDVTNPGRHVSDLVDERDALRAQLADALNGREEARVAFGRVSDQLADAERVIRHEILHTPVLREFVDGVMIEALHQVDRWGPDHDAAKTPWDWFWLIGYVAQKAASALEHVDIDKALHHTVTTASVIANWHRQILALPPHPTGPGATED